MWEVTMPYEDETVLVVEPRARLGKMEKVERKERKEENEIEERYETETGIESEMYEGDTDGEDGECEEEEGDGVEVEGDEVKKREEIEEEVEIEEREGIYEGDTDGADDGSSTVELILPTPEGSIE